MIRRILLDIDDTSNSFTMHVLRLLGCDVGDFDYHKFPTHVGYDIIAAYEELKPPGARSFTVSEFWDSITRDIWANCPTAREFNLILGHAEALVGQDNVCVLTSPTIDPECLAGKLEWIQKNFPRWLHRQFLIGPRKHFCARPDALLIDDNDEQVRRFREHGGQALLVPRPWNSMHGTDTLPYLMEQFDRLTIQRVY